MLKKVLYVLAVGSFVVGMAGMAMAAEKSWGAYGSDQSAVSSQQPESNSSATEMRGPVSTGSMPDLSGNERSSLHTGNHWVNSDKINTTVPSQEWNAYPFARPNVQAGE